MPPTAEVAPKYRTLIAGCTVLATLMQALDSTIANVALPYMQGSLGATADQITWVLTSYVVAAAIMTAPVGWMSTRFGRRNFFIGCLTGFTIASMLCGIAQTLDQIVLFRLLQGICGAALVPLSQSTMLDLYPPERRGAAMAMWGMGVMVGPILGPTLGGWLTDAYDWRWVFFINLPIGLLTIAGLVLFLKETGQRSKVQFDFVGFGVLSLGIGALQLMLDRGGQKDWFSSSEILIEAALAALGGYLFTVHILLTDKPFISRNLFKDVNYASGFFMMFAIGMVLLASSALMAPFLQTLDGYPVRQAGLLMAPRGLGTMAAMMVAGRLASRMEPRLLMLIGFSLLSFSLWKMSGWSPDVGPFELSWVTTLQGAGLGLVFIPLQVVAFATLSPSLRTDGTALFSLVRNVGSAIGVSVTSFLLARNTQIVHAQIAETVTPFNRMLQTGGAYFIWNDATAAGLSNLNAKITHDALSIAYIDDFKFMFWISLPSALLLLAMRSPSRTRTSPTAAPHAALD